MPFEKLISAGVRRKLSALRRVLRAHIVGAGLSWVVLALVGAVFLTLGVDRGLDMDRAQRALIVGISLAGVGYVLWRFLLRPLRVPMGPEELALVLERHYGQLGDRLISALQFAAHDTSRAGASEDLIRAVARQANALTEKLNAAEPVEATRTLKRMSLAGGAVAVLAVFTIFNLQLMGLWFQRNVLFADVPWPRQTYLSVEGGPEFKVVRGGPLAVEVRADADHVVPREVTFHMDFPGLGMVAENIAPASPGGNTYVKTFDNVADVFRFYVTGNDDRTDWCRVIVVEPPMLEEVRFTVEHPGYMNRPAAEVSSEHGVLSVPAGSRMLIDGRANKHLAAGRMLLDDKVVADLRVKTVPGPDGADAPVGVSGTLLLPERIQPRSLVLRFELTDSEGVTNRRGATFALRIEPDRAPTLSMRRKGVRGDVTAVATIPLDIRARDDYGVAGLQVAVKPTAPPAAATQPTTAASQPAGERTLDVAGASQADKDVQIEYGLDLRGMGLIAGQLIRVRALARDTLPESFGGPNFAESPALTFKIVSEDELMAELVRREQEIRQEFTRAVNLQAEVRDRVRAARDQLAAAGKIDQQVTGNLAAAGRDQGRVAASCSVVAGQFQEVLDEMNYNRIGDPLNKARLVDRIITPLRGLSEKPMLDVAQAVAGASKDTDAASLREFTARSAEVLDGFHKRLEAILEEMKQLESRQELARVLKRIISDVSEVKKAIEEMMEKQGQTIFDPASQPGR